MKSDFVSTVSHELRTPLAAIYGAAMTLRRGDVVLDSEQREILLGVRRDRRQAAYKRLRRCAGPRTGAERIPLRRRRP